MDRRQERRGGPLLQRQQLQQHADSSAFYISLPRQATAGGQGAGFQGGAEAMGPGFQLGGAGAVGPSQLSLGYGGFERHTTGIGSRLMERMGWSEGAGLGRVRQGRPEPVAAEKRPKNLGLGAGEEW